MKRKNKVLKTKNISTSRRKFIRQLSIGVIAASSYSVISLSNIACSYSTNPDDFNNGTGYKR